uniref:S-S bond formation pathway protein n=1 Tax=Rousettus bat poxvirus TaxID=3141933 RepID=A0AAU7E0I7_9POXV
MAAPSALRTLYDVFVEKYLRKVSLYAATASVTCGVHIGTIVGTLKNCKVSVLNRCTSDDTLSLRLLLDSLTETLALLPPGERARVAKELGVDPDTPHGPSPLERRCRDVAALAQNIDVQTLNLGTCVAPPGARINLQFINTGSAAANCGMEAAVHALVPRAALVPVHNRLALDKSTVVRLLSVAGVVMLILLAFALIRRTVTLRYRYGAPLYI